MIRRRGFTLWETTIVFAVMAITALLVVPQWLRLGATESRGTADHVLALLRDARRLAIMSNQLVTVHLAPRSGSFRVDTTGVNGTGTHTSGQLDLSALASLESSQPRLTFVFRATGATIGDTLIVREANSAVLIAVDPWSGEAAAHAR